MRPKNSRGIKCANEAQIQERQDKALSLRLEGKTYQQIGDELGVSKYTAFQDVRVIARLKYQGMIDKDELLLMEQNEQCRALLKRQLDLAMSDDLLVGETREKKNGEIFDVTLPVWESTGQATDRVIRIMEHMAKINGLTSIAKNNTPEEIGQGVAQGVLSALQKISESRRNAPAVIEAHLLPDDYDRTT